jgi:glc operon protein GlcG
MKFMRSLAIAVVASTIATAAQSQVVDRKVLTLEGAKQIIVAAEAYARSQKAPGGAIAIVDEGGNLLLVERLDNTFAAAASVSIGKARTAAIFRRPTKFFEDAIKNGRTSLVAMPDFTPLQGGIPIEYDGKIVGAIGVSGAASAQQDEEIAIAGANALKSKQ